MDTGYNIDRAAIGTYRIILLFISYTDVDDRSTYVLRSYMSVDVTIIDPCSYVVEDGYDI